NADQFHSDVRRCALDRRDHRPAADRGGAGGAQGVGANVIATFSKTNSTVALSTCQRKCVPSGNRSQTARSIVRNASEITNMAVASASVGRIFEGMNPSMINMAASAGT